MYLRGKPTPYGYKLWVLASDSGYPFNTEVYGGKIPSIPGDQSENHSLGYRVVTSLLNCIRNPLCREVYFDNFFTSYNLLQSLREKNVKVTGTVRDNRLNSYPLMESKAMKKKNRGLFMPNVTGK